VIEDDSLFDEIASKIRAAYGRLKTPPLNADFSSGLKSGAIDAEALEFLFHEAGKKLEASRALLAALQDRAKTYMTFIGVGFASMFGLLGFALDRSGVPNGQIFLAPLISCSLFFLIGLALSFWVLNVANGTGAGRAPKDTLTPDHIASSANGRQKHRIVFKSLEFYQSLITYNENIASAKIKHLTWACAMIWCGIAAFIISFLCTLL
jgi:hypothetical protein